MSKVRCPRCRRLTHTTEMVETPSLGWTCARCLEDARGDKAVTG